VGKHYASTTKPANKSNNKTMADMFVNNLYTSEKTVAC